MPSIVPHSLFPCAASSSCHIPLSSEDPIVQWPRTPPFHGGNTGSNPVRVAKRFSLGKCSTKGSYACLNTSFQVLRIRDKCCKIGHSRLFFAQHCATIVGGRMTPF